MKNFKGMLLELVKKIKKTGIVKKLYSASSREEFRASWLLFSKNNRELIKEIMLWHRDYKENCSEKLFVRGEKIEDIEEVIIFIHFLYYQEEYNLFEDTEDLRNALYETQSELAKTVADLMKNYCILEITSEVIFEQINKQTEKEESGTNHSLN